MYMANERKARTACLTFIPRTRSGKSEAYIHSFAVSTRTQAQYLVELEHVTKFYFFRHITCGKQQRPAGAAWRRDFKGRPGLLTPACGSKKTSTAREPDIALFENPLYSAYTGSKVRDLWGLKD
jgi:hypothetical protein